MYGMPRALDAQERRDWKCYRHFQHFPSMGIVFDLKLLNQALNQISHTR
jgi:hypothetical protein